jgi:hypothetical protein
MPRPLSASRLPTALPFWRIEERRVISHIRLEAENRCQLLHTNSRVNSRGFDGVGEGALRSVQVAPTRAAASETVDEIVRKTAEQQMEGISSETMAAESDQSRF